MQRLQGTPYQSVAAHLTPRSHWALWLTLGVVISLRGCDGWRGLAAHNPTARHSQLGAIRSCGPAIRCIAGRRRTVCAMAPAPAPTPAPAAPESLTVIPVAHQTAAHGNGTGEAAALRDVQSLSVVASSVLALGVLPAEDIKALLDGLCESLPPETFQARAMGGGVLGGGGIAPSVVVGHHRRALRCRYLTY